MSPVNRAMTLIVKQGVRTLATETASKSGRASQNSSAFTTVAKALGALGVGAYAYKTHQEDQKLPHYETTVVGNGMNGCGVVSNLCLEGQAKNLHWTSLNETLSSMSGPRNFGLSRCTDPLFGRMLEIAQDRATKMEKAYETITGKKVQIVQKTGFVTLAPKGAPMDREMQIGAASGEIQELEPEQSREILPHLNTTGYHVYYQPEGGVIDVDALTEATSEIAKNQGIELEAGKKLLGYRGHIPLLERPGYKVRFQEANAQGGEPKESTISTENLVLMLGPNLKEVARTSTRATLVEEKLFAVHLVFEGKAAKEFLQKFPGPALNVQMPRNNHLGVEPGVYYFSPVVKLQDGSVMLRGGVYHTQDPIEVTERQPEIAESIDLEQHGDRLEGDYMTFLNYFVKGTFQGIEDRDDVYVQSFFCPISKMKDRLGKKIEGIPSHSENTLSGRLVWAAGNGISGKYSPGNGFAVSSYLKHAGLFNRGLSKAPSDEQAAVRWLKFGETQRIERRPPIVR